MKCFPWSSVDPRDLWIFTLALGLSCRRPLDQSGRLVRSHSIIRHSFGNPAHKRYLEFDILEFDIWKLGYFDILELGMLVFILKLDSFGVLEPGFLTLWNLLFWYFKTRLSWEFGTGVFFFCILEPGYLVFWNLGFFGTK